MGAIKSDGYDTEILEQAKLYSALGHPARIEIVKHIYQCGSCNHKDLRELLPLSASSVQSHIKTLRYAGFLDEYSYISSYVIRLNMEVVKQSGIALMEVLTNEPKAEVDE